MTNKDRATGYERKALEEFKKMPGYREGRRTPSSFGVFDLWVIMEDGVHLVQVKSTKVQKRFKSLEKEISELKLPSYCIKELWIWYSYRSTVTRKRIENLKGWVKYKYVYNTKR